MKKLRKLQKNKKKFNAIIIYGIPAVGKFTVASELHKLLKYNFFHNHHVHDLARQLFERGNIHLDKIIINIRLLVFKEISEAKIDVITTHTYSADYVSKIGLTDPKYMKKIETIIKKNNGCAYFVHLIADEKEILKRVSNNSRKNYRKLRNKKIMKEILKENSWKIIAPVKNNIQIDNTNLSAKKVAQIIIKHFKLQP